MISPAYASSTCSREEAHESNHAGYLDVPIQSQMFQSHSTLKTTRGYPQEGDTIPVSRVHVGLDLENKTGERRFRRFDFPLDRVS